MKKKSLITILCVCLLVTASVMATLAYLTDRDSVANTFTVGKVDITLDEADVDEDGKLIPDAPRVKENEYHLIPGQTYIKDPTMTVVKDSEESYVRMMVTINCMTELDAIFANHPTLKLTDIFGGYDAAKWTYIGKTEDAAANTMTYEFRYYETVTPGTADKVLEPLFTEITIPGVITGTELESIKDLKIEVVGHAIQAATFEADAATNKTAEDVAWDAFQTQWEAERKNN